MTRRGAAVALWLAFVFVAWNVAYDRRVAMAAAEFTHEQVLRSQRGEAVTPIHTGFSPRVGEAARFASVVVTPLLIAGSLVLFWSFRRSS